MISGGGQQDRAKPERMSFPVDTFNSCSHEDLESSAESYLSDLRKGDPNHPEFLFLPGHGKIPISLTTVGFVPLYGEEQTPKVLALFAPGDLFTAVALYLANQWWSVDDIVRTTVSARQGLHQVKSIGERIILYVLNRIIYRKREMERNEVPFLCHGSKDYAKIMWKKGEAIGFYSVKPTGSICASYCDQKYRLPVLDTMFVRQAHRERDSGLIILEDYVDSFMEECLGLRYPLSPFVYTACKQYLEKYPGDDSLFWQVEGAGCWFQRTSVTSIIQRENLRIAEASQKEKESCQAESQLQQSAAVSEAREQKYELELQQNCLEHRQRVLDSDSNNDHISKITENTDSQKDKESTDVHPSTSQGPNIAPVFIRTQSSHLKSPRTGKCRQESEPGTSQGNEENALPVPENRLELPALKTQSSEDFVKEPEENTVETDKETYVENEQTAIDVKLHVSPPEKQNEKEETPSEPLNGEVTEETGKTSLVTEEKTANQVLSGESDLQSESQGEEPLTLVVPLILESSPKPSEDTVSEKVLNANDSEMLIEESTSVEKEGNEEQQDSEKTTTENAAASASKEEPFDNGLPNSTVAEAAEESFSENSLEDANEEAGHNLNQSSLTVVELEGVSFQKSPGQEGQKNQLEEHSEESAVHVDKLTQTGGERAADSSSEEMEIEVPIVDRRTLRRKAKGYKGPPKKKGKPA
ncbi:soluble lamin-associated protein of 75 kDa [Aegotheles albertisi]